MRSDFSLHIFLRAFSTVAASLSFVLYYLVAWHGDQCSKCTVYMSSNKIFAAYVKQQISDGSISAYGLILVVKR